MKTSLPRERGGFTLIEILIALSGLVVLALAATNYLFSILSQRDQAIAEAMALDQIETVAAVLADRIRSASTIRGDQGGKRLALIGPGECWLLQIDEANQSLNYGLTRGAGCQPPETADEALTSQKAQIQAASFSLLTSDGSRRSVSFDWTVVVTRPLWQASQHQSNLFVNVVDEGGGDDDED